MIHANIGKRIYNDDLKNFKTFKFDKVFDQNTTQSELYNQVQINNLVNKVIEVFRKTDINFS